MNYRQKAARASMLGNLFFFVFILLSLFAGAFAVSASETATLVISLCLCAVFLFLSGVAAYLGNRYASRFNRLLKEEEARALAEKEAAEALLPGEDGLPAAFCREIRGYSPAQLRLILDEQKEEYTPEEFTFIEKVLAEKE